MPASSRMDFLLLAKAKAIRSDSNISVITYLRTESCCAERIPAREEQSENVGTTMQTPSSYPVSNKFNSYPHFESVLPVKITSTATHILRQCCIVCMDTLSPLLQSNLKKKTPDPRETPSEAKSMDVQEFTRSYQPVRTEALTFVLPEIAITK
ncbi:hypothetical protein BTVI_62250 [Pitangus sulphuratus]|nr:hypothetical protein BTVI_62250 [Pitangus sulphuratus]